MLVIHSDRELPVRIRDVQEPRRRCLGALEPAFGQSGSAPLEPPRCVPRANARVAAAVLRRACATAVAVFSAWLGLCLGDDLSLSGYCRTDAVVARQPWPDGLPFEQGVWYLSTSLRLQCDWRLDDGPSIHVAYSMAPQCRDTALNLSPSLLAAPGAQSYRIADFEEQAYPEAPDSRGSFVLHHNLDRVYCLWPWEHADLLVGRQAIAWGSARFINPTDVIAPFTFTALSQEERYGVDAVRLRIPLGPLSEFDLGYVPGEDLDFRNSAFFVRTKSHVRDTDISLLAVGFRRHLLLGLDVARALGDAGAWLESAYVKPGFFEHSDDEQDKGYLRLSVGVDTRLAGDTVGFAEYHFSSAGTSEEAEYADLASTPAYNDGGVYLLGRHYIALGLNHQFSPLLTLAAAVTCNINDHSVHLAPELEVNMAQDLYVTLGLSIGIGATPAVANDANATSLLSYESEFGAYADFVFLTVRKYF